MSVGFDFKSLLHERRIAKKAMLFCSRWLCPPTPSIPLSADTANNGCLHSVSLSHSSLCVRPILACGKGEGVEQKTLVNRNRSSLLFLVPCSTDINVQNVFPPPAYFMGTYETSCFICAESLRLIISIKKTPAERPRGQRRSVRLS